MNNKKTLSSKIKFVFFDLGGVVIFDFSKNNKWEEMINGLHLDQNQSDKFSLIFKSYAKKFNFCIDYDVDNLIPVLQKEGIPLPLNYSILGDMVNRFDANPSITPLLNKLEKSYSLGILTNMFPRMFSSIEKKGIIPPINWKCIVDSSKIGKQKPGLEFYEYAQNQLTYSKSQILFVDNLEINLEGVKKLGWQTFLYDPADAIKSNKELEKLLL